MVAEEVRLLFDASDLIMTMEFTLGYGGGNGGGGYGGGYSTLLGTSSLVPLLTCFTSVGGGGGYSQGGGGYNQGGYGQGSYGGGYEQGRDACGRGTGLSIAD